MEKSDRLKECYRQASLNAYAKRQFAQAAGVHALGLHLDLEFLRDYLRNRGFRATVIDSALRRVKRLTLRLAQDQKSMARIKNRNGWLIANALQAAKEIASRSS